MQTIIASTSYYHSCYEQYDGERRGPALTACAPDLPLYGFGAAIVAAGKAPASNRLLHLPGDWSVQVARLAVSAAAALDDDSLILHQTDPQARQRDPARRLGNPLALDGLDAVVDTIVSQLEATLYGCHVAVDKVHVYRQLATPDADFSGGSWVWHADGHPSEFIKALVYLSEVDDSCSAFQLLWSDARQRALRCVAAPMDEHNWCSGSARAGSVFDSAFIEHWAGRGYHPRTVLGPAGTIILFATNCVHRGTLGRGKARDTLGLRLRPCTSPQRPRLQALAAIDRYRDTLPYARPA